MPSHNYNRLNGKATRNAMLYYGVGIVPATSYVPLKIIRQTYNISYKQINRFIRYGWISVQKLKNTNYHGCVICDEEIREYLGYRT